MIRDIGADAINYREEDFADALRARTSGRGVDVILDIMGGSYFGRNMGALASGRTVGDHRFRGGAMAEKVDLLALVAKRVIVTGSMLRPRTARRKGRHADGLYKEVWPILSADRCLPIITKSSRS